MTSVRALVALVACHASVSAFDPPLPANQGQVGWLFGNTDLKVGEGTLIELYGDFQCPDTRDAWLNVIKDLDSWIVSTGQKAAILYVPFPLPYHFNSYRASLSGIVTIDLLAKKGVAQADAFVAVANQVFGPNQDKYQNDATANLTNGEVYGDVLFPILAGAGLKTSDKAAFLAGIQSHSPAESQLRASWKYACSHTVSGTPLYIINGATSEPAASWTLAEWKNLISA